MKDWRSEAAYDYIDKLTPAILPGSSSVTTPNTNNPIMNWRRVGRPDRFSRMSRAGFARTMGVAIFVADPRNSRAQSSADLLDPANQSRRTRPSPPGRTRREAHLRLRAEYLRTRRNH